MPRKPNYKFERKERDQAKKEKLAAKAKAKSDEKAGLTPGDEREPGDHAPGDDAPGDDAPGDDAPGDDEDDEGDVIEAEPVV